MRSPPHSSSFLVVLTAIAGLGGCGTTPTTPPSATHLMADKVAPPNKDIPALVQSTVMLPRPKPAAKVETYSVSVRNIAVEELLFALARDAKLNIDLHSGITGAVTINAIDQTLQQILTRIGKQVDMRWELDGPNLIVMPDTPFLRTYKVDYVNMSRDVSGTVSINTQIASTSSGANATTAAGNNSSTTVNSKAKNNFWDSLEKNIKDLLRETDKILPEGSSETVIEHNESQNTSGDGALTQTPGRTSANARISQASSTSPTSLNREQQGATTVRRTTFREAASVIVNPEAGVVVVRATSRQHEKVQEYVDLVTRNSRRQVMIEATIVEVGLSDKFEQGIDWSVMPTGSAGTKLSIGSTTGLQVSSYNTAQAADKAAALTGVILKGVGVISGQIKLLENFGTVKVLSSPKISVLNNQTAMLKVVNNYVYFNVASNTTTSASGPSQTTVTTTPHSVSIGLVMSVTPQIGENDMVLLNVRPTISSLFGAGKKDPNPSIPQGLENIVPEIQTREMESMLRLSNGEIAIMGGLMEDKVDNTGTSVPGLGDLPGIGSLFGSRTDKRTKTELVVFLRPTIIRDASMNGDYRELKSLLPEDSFLENVPENKKPSFRPYENKRP